MKPAPPVTRILIDFPRGAGSRGLLPGAWPGITSSERRRGATAQVIVLSAVASILLSLFFANAGGVGPPGGPGGRPGPERAPSAGTGHLRPFEAAASTALA